MKTTIPAPPSFQISVEDEATLAVEAFTAILAKAAHTPQVISWPKSPEGGFLSAKAVEAALVQIRAAGWKVSYDDAMRDLVDAGAVVLRVLTLTPNLPRPQKGVPGWTDIRIERAS
jgi:hypothetical protein